MVIYISELFVRSITTVCCFLVDQLKSTLVWTTLVSADPTPLLPVLLSAHMSTDLDTSVKSTSTSDRLSTSVSTANTKTDLLGLHDQARVVTVSLMPFVSQFEARWGKLAQLCAEMKGMKGFPYHHSTILKIPLEFIEHLSVCTSMPKC